jgi:hypothetical protein
MIVNRRIKHRRLYDLIRSFLLSPSGVSGNVDEHFTFAVCFSAILTTFILTTPSPFLSGDRLALFKDVKAVSHVALRLGEEDCSAYRHYRP